jgi:hypothetical protein
MERVEHSEGHLEPHDRDADATQAQAQLVAERRGLGILQCLIGQPFDDGAA